MKSYRTLAIVRFFAGKIGLTDNQVKNRMNCLSKINDGVYEITREVVFKAGEMIGLENPPKPYQKVLESLEPEKPVAEKEKLQVQDEIKIEVEKAVATKKRKYTKRKA